MTILFLLIAIPLATAFIVALVGERVKRFYNYASVLATAGIFTLTLQLAFSLKKGGLLLLNTGVWNAPQGLPILMDGLSAFMLVTANLVAFCVALYSTVYMDKYTGRWKYFSLLLVMVGGINGVLLAGDLFNLYLFLEITAISGYFLVAFGTDAEGLEASFKYAVMGAIASSFILLGMALLYGYTSTLNLADMSLAIATKGTARVVYFAAVLFFMGFGLKAALVPFHAWLPYAHSAAPAPVSAMLSGVSIKVLGIYALMRIFFNCIGMTPAFSAILVTLAVLSMLVGSFLAFAQTDIKRLYAYSSISQVGYIVLGLGIGTPLGVIGALFHLFNHSAFKSLLFLTSGMIERQTGTRDLRKIRGIIYEQPVTGYSTLIGGLSICGMPPFGGFWSKFIIIFACVRAGRLGLGVVAALVGLLTLAYYFRALTPVLFGANQKTGLKPDKQFSWVMALPVFALAIITLASAFVLLPDNSLNILLNQAASVLITGTAYASHVTGSFQ